MPIGVSKTGRGYEGETEVGQHDALILPPGQLSALQVCPTEVSSSLTLGPDKASGC